LYISYDSRNTEKNIFYYSVSSFVVISEMESIYCAVWTDCLEDSVIAHLKKQFNGSGGLLPTLQAEVRFRFENILSRIFGGQNVALKEVSVLEL